MSEGLSDAVLLVPLHGLLEPSMERGGVIKWQPVHVVVRHVVSGARDQLHHRLLLQQLPDHPRNLEDARLDPGADVERSRRV